MTRRNFRNNADVFHYLLITQGPSIPKAMDMLNESTGQSHTKKSLYEWKDGSIPKCPKVTEYMNNYIAPFVVSLNLPPKKMARLFSPG